MTALFTDISRTQMIQQDINLIAEWASVWQMKFNVTKCCCIHFFSSETGYFFNTYTLYITQLPCSNHCKYLAIANSTLGLLQRNIKASAHIKEIAYKALLRPKLEYA